MLESVIKKLSDVIAGVPSSSEPSALLNGSEQVDSWTLTTTDVIQASHCWRISNFSHLTEPNGEFLSSSLFYAREREDAKFCIDLYPRGDPEADENYVSIFLRLVHADQPVLAKFRVTIVDHKDVVRLALANENAFNFQVKARWGRSKFIERSVLLNQLEGYAADDNLRLKCDVTIIMNTKTVSGRNDTLRFQVPECRLAEDLAKSFEFGHFSDVSVCTAGGLIRAHKHVLSSRSPVFAAMFRRTTDNRTDLVDVGNVRYDVMYELLRFMYTGKCFSLDVLGEELLIAAHKFGLERLKVMSEASLCLSLSLENYEKLLLLSEVCDAMHLKEHIVEFMRNNPRDVLDTVDWKNLAMRYSVAITDFPCESDEQSTDEPQIKKLKSS